MIAKRLPWKEEYATNSELFWKDLRENESKYTEEPIEEDSRTNLAEYLGFGHIEINSEDERRQYMKSLLGVD